MIRPFLGSVVTMLLILSCAGESSVDEAALEADIAAVLLPEHPDAITSVSCPDAASAGPGVPIECSVAVGDQDLPVAVDFSSDGVILVKPEAELLDGAAAAEQLADTFTAELGIPTSVECAAPYIVLTPGTTFECVATDDQGVARVLDVTVDQAGQMVLTIR